jgi:hypothetical protein
MAVSTNISKNFPLAQVYPHPELDLRDRSDLSSENMRFRSVTISYLQSLSAERRRIIRLYSGHFPFVACELLGGGFRTMTLLRDPVDRTISLLRQFQRHESISAAGQQTSSPPLEEIYERADVYEPLVHNHQTKIFSMTAADDPKGYMQAIDTDEDRLALARRNLETVDVLGLTERHADFVDDLVAEFGWSLKRDVWANVAPDDGPAVDDSFRRKIESDNAIDVEFYDYARQLVAVRRD